MRFNEKHSATVFPEELKLENLSTEPHQSYRLVGCSVHERISLVIWGEGDASTIATAID